MSVLVENKLEDLIERNSISMDFFLEETYNSMLISIFEVLVLEMTDLKIKKLIRERFVNSKDKILTTKNLIYEKTKCIVNDKEAEQLYKYLYAFFTKKDKRISYSNIEREEKLIRQEYSCNICKTKINIDNSELDHIIPWVLVGDELGNNNLQMLCKECNRRKSKNYIYNLKMFLINK